MAGDQLSFKSFLSHRYKSAEVNLYFFKIFSEVAEVQFEVDDGTFSTNVTRLERMIRDADTFIGIYPFPGTPQEARNPEELKKQSKYFRLEIDLAVRSQKPAIIFYDKRYGNIVKPPGSILCHSFDFDEITGPGGYPSYSIHKNAFARFCELAGQKRKFDEVQVSEEKDTVVLFTSTDVSNNPLYDKNTIAAIQQLLEQYNYPELQVINWPVALDSKLFRLLEKADLAIVEHSGLIAAAGIPSYLHGRFIPMIRLKYTPVNTAPDIEPLSEFLFGGSEVGYRKDMIEWCDSEALKNGISAKLENIRSDVRRVNTYEQAKKYFMSATLRKEAVFVSYSGKDVDVAKNIIEGLKKYFQTVFDYRDGKSIVPGQPWLDEIFNKLSASAIGVNLLSASYLQSGNCIHEAREMVANLDNKKIKLYPIKLYPETINLPPFFGDIQYMRFEDYPNPDEIVKEINRLSQA